jgi:25S rRNA (uracil2634-N3)-methyltransferase
MGKRSSLKSALSSHQTRVKKKQDAIRAAQVAEQKGKKPSQTKGKGKTLAAAPQTTVPFRPVDRILLVGEGNFSFARALVCDPPTVLQHLPPSNVTATAYDSEEECYEKYPEAVGIVQALRAKGSEVLFSVDATKLEKHSVLRGRKYDKIMWNFPHAGIHSEKRIQLSDTD